MKDFDKIEEIVSHFKSYVSTKITRTKLDAAAKTSDLITFIVVRILVAIIFVFFIIFASEAAAYALAEYFGKLWLGFILIAACYLLTGLLIWLTRERLLRIPIMNAIISRLFGQKHEPDEED